MRRQLTDAQETLKEAPRQLASEIQRYGASTMPSIDPAPQLLAELAEMRHQFKEAQALLKDAPKQLASEIQRNAASNPHSVDLTPQLMSELAEMRQQVSKTQAQLGQTHQQLVDTRAQLTAAIHEATSAISVAPPVVVHQEGGEGDAPRRVKVLERERNELESELELVRARASELQNVVQQQRRELDEHRTEITNELRMLRELAAQWPHATQPMPVHGEDDLVGATAGSGGMPVAADPVVNSVMAQFARLQKDVAQRRKKH
jgi:methyl-accepting chemotaxis protein